MVAWKTKKIPQFIIQFLWHTYRLEEQSYIQTPNSSHLNLLTTGTFTSGLSGIQLKTKQQSRADITMHMHLRITLYITHIIHVCIGNKTFKKLCCSVTAILHRITFQLLLFSREASEKAQLRLSKKTVFTFPFPRFLLTFHKSFNSRIIAVLRWWMSYHIKWNRQNTVCTLQAENRSSKLIPDTPSSYFFYWVEPYKYKRTFEIFTLPLCWIIDKESEAIKTGLQK